MRVERGFTLIELIIVIAVLAILVTTAVPGFNRFVAHERRVSTVMSLVHALNLARSRAVLSGNYVAVCPSVDSRTCAADGSQWNTGWLVFINLDPESPPEIDDGERVLLRHGPVEDALEVTANREGFNFRPRSIRSTAGSLFVCTRNHHNEAVIVSYTGRVRTSARYDGEPVTCD
ncbi:MAG TPA: GspH/FimT family pseudopilin [Gammaproteobacteria bacterium]|nr:GspH/FimT family pseudopilin [Gammaproteobacteria bacterium]